MNKESTNGSLCPKCQHHLVAQAVRCSNCGTLVEEAKAEAQKALAGGTSGTGTASGNVLPFWKYALLIVCTFGVYEVWWLYRTWAFVKSTRNVRGVWGNIGSTIGSALPLFELFFIWSLLAGVRDIAGQNQLPRRFSAKYVYITYQLLLIAGFVYDFCLRTTHGITGAEAVGYFSFTLFLMFVPKLLLFLAQHSINDYWISKEPAATEQKMGRGEIVALAIGALLWVSVSIGVYRMAAGEIDLDGKEIRQEAPARH